MSATILFIFVGNGCLPQVMTLIMYNM